MPHGKNCRILFINTTHTYIIYTYMHTPKETDTRVCVHLYTELDKHVDLVFLHSSVSKESSSNAGDLGSIPGSGRSLGEGILPYSCLENPHGQRSLTGYSPWGRKELDMTVQLSTALHTPSYFLRQGEAVPPHKKRTRSKGKGLGITSLHMPNL